MSLLVTKNLDVTIANKQVCHQLNINFESGQIWGILGRNGVGKTTFLHTLSQLRTEFTGEIHLNNKNIKDFSRKEIAQSIGIQLQHTEDPFPSTVLETVLDGRHPFISNWQWENENDKEKAETALSIVGLKNLMLRQVNQLSGGERQRVSLATLIAQDPKIFLLDEPNSHLDLNYQIKLLDHFCSYSKTNERLLIMSLHDINLAKRYCSHIILMTEDGHHLAGETSQMLNQKNLSETFKYPIKQLASDGESFFYPG